MAVKQLEELSERAQALYKRANEAAQRQNYGYMIDLLNQVLETEPAFLEGRKLLRMLQMREFENRGMIAKKMAGMAAMSGIVKAQSALKKNPAQALVEAERVLNADPSNATALSIEADAAEAIDIPEVAAFALETLRQTRPNDVKLLKRMGEVYGRMGSSDKARQAFEIVLKLKPDDADAFKAMKDATAQGALNKGGWEQEGDFRNKMKDKQEAKTLEQESRVVRSEDQIDNLIAETEAKLQQQPSNLAVARQLARLYREQGQFDHSLNIFQQVLEHQSGDPALEREIYDTRLKKMDAEIAAKEAASQQAPQDEALKQAYEAEKQRKEDFIFEECKKRVERYPNDLAFKCELGELLFQKGLTPEAIKQFQQASKHPQLRVRVLKYLGQCFMKQKLIDIAIRQFITALSEIPTMDDMRKEVLYHLGVAYETKGDKDKASDCYQQIYEVDVAYLDVAKRLGLE